MTKRVLVLGSTGSIGRQTLQLVRDHPGELVVAGLAARGSWREVLQQAQEFGPCAISLESPEAAAQLQGALPPGCTLLEGAGAAERLCDECDFDVAIHGIVGAAGLGPSTAVLSRGKVLGLANKESLVIAGDLLMELARTSGGAIVPVDSEHSAVFQCLRGERIEDVRRVLLTASGGPFRTWSAERIRDAAPEDALAHPNWSMGERVTIGSSTLMNKALEVIELHHLFGLERARIEVAVHPQSIVHSMVEFVDGSVMAQLGPPDMRGPIHHALHHPERIATQLEGFSFELFRELTFEQPDLDRFPALGLGFRCVEEGGTSGAVLNAADEVAVEAFLARQIPHHQIAELCTGALDARCASPEACDAGSIEGLLAADQWARAHVRASIESGAHGSPAARSAPAAPNR